MQTKNLLKQFTLAGALAIAVNAQSAEYKLSVSLGDSIRPVTHVASGSLYGMTETLPANIDEHVKPLKPNTFLNPAMAGYGHQQPIGDAFKVAERLKGTTGKVHIRLADILPGWPYGWKSWDHWKTEVTNIINKKKSCGLTNLDGYEIWNEPYGTWKDANGRYHEDLWKPTYQLIRQLDPNAKIIGPSFAFYSSSRMENFVKFCKENNCMPDVISWHQWGSGGFVGALEHYRSLEKKYGISPRKISINEYSSDTHTLEGCPGISVPFISKFERHGVESAMISWWFTGLPGRLGSLLTAKNEKGGGWYLYKWYGDMEGFMSKVTPPNDKSDGVDGFANVNRAKREASIILGGSSIGKVNVEISNLPAFFGNEVEIQVEYVTWEDKDKAVPAPQTISKETYTLNNGSVTVPVNVTNGYYAYRLYITPGTVIPQSPFHGTPLALPGTIEAEDFDNGSEGTAFHDNDRENKGETIRTDAGVDIYEADKTGTYAIGYTQAGEWTAYTVNVEEEAVYDISARLSGSSSSGIILLLDNSQITDTIFAQTDDWETYDVTKARTRVVLPKGEHELKIVIAESWVNIDWLKFTPYDPTGIELTDKDECNGEMLYQIIDMNGRVCGTVKASCEDNLMEKVKEKATHKGLYILRGKKASQTIFIE